MDSIDSMIAFCNLEIELAQFNAKLVETHGLLRNSLNMQQKRNRKEQTRTKQESNYDALRLQNEIKAIDGSIEALISRKQSLYRKIAETSVKWDERMKEFEGRRNEYCQLAHKMDDRYKEWIDLLKVSNYNLSQKYVEILANFTNWDFANIKCFVKKAVLSAANVSNENKRKYLASLERTREPFGDANEKLVYLQYELNIENQNDWNSIDTYIKTKTKPQFS